MHFKKQLASEVFINVSVPVAIAMFWRLQLPESFLLVAGSLLIDIDHLLYYLFSKYPKKIKSAVQFFKQEFKSHTPHLYIFHTFEVLFILLTLSYLFGGYLFYLFLGFLLNFIIDIFTYLIIYKSFSPWLKYFSLTLHAL